MSIATFIGDIQDLTPAIIAMVVLILGLVYRKPLGAASERLTKFAARRNDLEVQADLDSPSAGRADTADSGSVDTDQRDTVKGELTAEEEDREPDSKDAAATRKEMIDQFFAGEEAKGEREFKRLQQLETDPTEIRLDQARRMASRFIGGIDPEALEELQQFADDPDVAGFGYRMIGICLAEASRHSSAAEAFEKSIELSKSSPAKADSASFRAKALTEMGQVATAISETRALIAEEEESEALVTLWQALAEAYESASEPALQAAALHQAALLAGNDPKRWFDAAYAYGGAGQDFAPLSIHCYGMALKFDRDYSAALNNIGVKCGQVGFSMLAVDYFEKAADRDHTLAMGNLASRYLKAGFEKQAKEVIANAQVHDNVHKKVAEVASSAAAGRNKQEKDLEELKAAASSASEALAAVAGAAVEDSSISPAGKWSFQHKPVQVEVDGLEIVLTWDTGKSFRSGQRFRGRICGGAAVGKFEIEGAAWKSDWESGGSGYVSLVGDERLFVRCHSDEIEFGRFLHSS